MKTNRRELWIIVAITLIGTALRIADLTGRSMWVDEGITLTRVFGSWQYLFKNIVILHGIYTIDLHPWFYFALTKGWGILGGNTEFTLKLVPAFTSILLIPATYTLARRMFTWPVALIAALLALTSPAYQWYGHELRMYPLVALLSCLTCYLVYRGVQPRNAGYAPWILWLALTMVSLFTHYSLVVIIGVQLLFSVLVIIRNRPRITWRTAISVVGVLTFITGVGIVFHLWSDMIQRALLFMRVIPGISLASMHMEEMIADVVNTMLFGMNASDPTNGIFTWFVIAVCAVGLLLPLQVPDRRNVLRSTSRQRLFIALTSIPVIFLVGLLSLIFSHQPSFRYSMPVVPVVHVLLAEMFGAALAYRRKVVSILRGWRPALQMLGKFAGVVALVSVFAVQMFGVAFTFIHTFTWQDDWRGMTQYIKNYWQPGDVVLINLLVPEDTLRLYLQDVPIQVLPIESVPISNTLRANFLNGYKRIWYASAISPNPPQDTSGGRLLLSLDRRQLIHFPGQTNILDLTLFDITSAVVDQPPATARAIPKQDSASVHPEPVAYEIQPGAPYNEHPNIHLIVYWSRPGGAFLPTDYSLAVRFKDTEQRDWADWFMPAGLETAPASWTGTRLYRADYIVPLPLGLPQQNYQLGITVGIGEKAEPVHTMVLQLDQSQVACCIRITHWSAKGSTASNDTTLWQASDVKVSGAEFASTIKPGEVLPVVLTWKLSAPATSEWQTVIQLDGLLGGNVAHSVSPTGVRGSPVISWPVGEPVRSSHMLQVPYTVKPGYYRLASH
jgi:4-amino-4-deoxy-L-arabinose transferase-like glycosyltransferase